MTKITNLKTYLNKPYKCYIPKCRSKCCINAPLPEDFLPKHKDKIQRQIFGAFNMGQNDIRDTYNSVIYSTRPIIFIGYDTDGKMLCGISPEVAKKLQLKNMDDVHNLLAEYEAKKIYNYCPFIKSDASCSVYNDRPPICKEFGTMPGKINECPEKASRLDILKFNLKSFFEVEVKAPFKFMCEMLKNKITSLIKK